MKVPDLVGRLSPLVSQGLRPNSPAAFAFALLCVAAAALLRLAVDQVAPNVAPFAAFFPAVLVAALVAGWAAGAFAIVLSALVVWLKIEPQAFVAGFFTTDPLAGFVLFGVAAGVTVLIADRYRAALRRLDEEEKYRTVVVEELGHRVKNKLATIYAILRHELRGHDDIWQSVSGRLRALSAADDFVVLSDGKGVELRQILEMELEPYGTSRYALHGEPVFVFAKMPTVLALIFHELATNAAKYGALSVSGGRLAISWRLNDGQIVIDWVESGGPPVTVPERRSFGSKLIERSLGGFGGSAVIEFAPSGVVCKIVVPKPAAKVRDVLDKPSAP